MYVRKYVHISRQPLHPSDYTPLAFHTTLVSAVPRQEFMGVLIPRKDRKPRFCVILWEQHVLDIQAVLDKLGAANLTVNMKKSTFFRHCWTCVFLDHMVSEAGIGL